MNIFDLIDALILTTSVPELQVCAAPPLKAPPEMASLLRSQLRPTITVDTSQWEGFDRSSFAFEKEDVQPRASVAERQSVDRKWGKAVALPKLQEFQARIIREVLERTPGTLPGPSSCHSTWASRARALMERNGAVQASSISGARVPGKKELAESPFGRMRLENRQVPVTAAAACRGATWPGARRHICLCYDPRRPRLCQRVQRWAALCTARGPMRGTTWDWGSRFRVARRPRPTLPGCARRAWRGRGTGAGRG